MADENENTRDPGEEASVEEDVLDDLASDQLIEMTSRGVGDDDDVLAEALFDPADSTDPTPPPERDGTSFGLDTIIPPQDTLPEAVEAAEVILEEVGELGEADDPDTTEMESVIEAALAEPQVPDVATEVTVQPEGASDIALVAARPAEAVQSEPTDDLSELITAVEEAPIRELSAPAGGTSSSVGVIEQIAAIVAGCGVGVCVYWVLFVMK